MTSEVQYYCFLPNATIHFILVYLPPNCSHYTVDVRTLNDFILQAKTAALRENSQLNFSVCLLGDFNLPSTDWLSMSSTCSSENAFLDLFHQHSLFPTNFQATHKAGNVLDNILITENFHFEVNVKSNVTLSDHFPLVFECFIEKTPYQFDPLLSTYSFNSYEGISVFSNSWSNFSFESYPSNVVSSFYSHLLAMIPVAFRKKTKKRLFNPFYYSSHSIHCQNKLQTLRRR